MYVYSNRPERHRFKTFITIFITAVVTFVVVEFTPKIVANYNNKIQQEEVKKLSHTDTTNVVRANEKITDETDFVSIIRESMPSIVGISVLKPDGEGIIEINVVDKWGIGTGVILSEKGYILTNQHLASNVNGTVNVTLDNGEDVKGKVIWNEPNLDLAVVQIKKRDDLKAIKLGSIENSEIGEEVIAIGNPLGLEFKKSVTKGVISGLGRTLKVEDETSTVIMENLIQTDASINTGNSGGPLINKNGEVIGINTVKITSAEGIGFAVPIDIIKPILSKLERDGTFDEGYIGIFAYDAEIVPYLTNKVSTNKGIYVATVNKNGPAYKAGLLVEDVILSVDNVTISKMTELREHIYKKSPGDNIELKVLRKDKEINIVVTLGRR